MLAVLAGSFAAFGWTGVRVIAAGRFGHRQLDLLLQLAGLLTDGVEFVEDGFQFLRTEIRQRGLNVSK